LILVKKAGGNGLDEREKNEISRQKSGLVLEPADKTAKKINAKGMEIGGWKSHQKGIKPNDNRTSHPK